MTELGTRSYDNLIAGSAVETVSTGYILLTGQVVVRGQMMGRITATGKWKKYQSASVDGSEIPRGVSAEAIDATAADKKIVIYTTGEFNKNALVFDGGDTLTVAVKNLLQDVNIHTKDSVSVTGVHSS